MCAPAAIILPLIGLGVSGAGTAASVISGRSQAARDQAAQDKYAADNKISAAESTNLALKDLTAREMEEMLAAAHETNQIQRDTNTIASTAVVAAAEAGVSGDSVEALMSEITSQSNRNLSTVRTNTGIMSAQLYREKQAAIARGQSQARGVQPVQINKPSVAAAAISIGTQALGTVDYLRQRSANLKAPIGT